MEMESQRGEKPATGVFGRAWRRVKALPEGLFAKVVDIARQTRDVATDDPRRVVHSLKAGLALTLVSLLYYLHPLYHNFGVSTMWAVMTVVVVFEFTVGATLGKGLNRALATLLACALGVGAHYLASTTGKICEPLLLGFFVFVQAVASTFIRFFPAVKARYDYGLLIFILTFCLVSISGFRTHEILELAHKRFSTIAIGASVCVIVSIFVCPVWAGEDLHRLVASNLEILGNFLEGFGAEYFKSSEEEESSKEAKPSMVGYKSVLNSKTTEEALANFARWEPGHGRFKFRHPWKQYLKVGTLTRQCACRVEALNGYLNSKIQGPGEMRRIMKGTCTKMSMESGKALQELASSVRNMNHPSSANKHMVNSKTAAKNLKLLLSSSFWEDVDLLQVIPVAAVASILTEIVVCVENIAESVSELAAAAQFKDNAESAAAHFKDNAESPPESSSSASDSDRVVIAVGEIMAAPAAEANQSRCL
nr:aluminum-activated malate transporter 2-like [Ipomoea trifida]